jgi:multiple sugar transport system ATP-binding protein
LRVQMRTEIKELHQRLKTTTVYVTHDQIEAMTMADKIVVMHDGIVEQIGTPLELYDTPANQFVAGFIGSPAMNLLEAELTEGGATVFGHSMEIPLTPEVRRQHAGGITIGIRPEYFRVSPDGTGVPVTVSVVEELGADAYVYGVAGASLAAGDRVTAGTPIVARVETRSTIQRGSTIHVTAKAENCRVFATATGERLDNRA